MGRDYRAKSKTFRKPKRPFEKDRLDAEMKIVGEYGLKNKREVWRVQYALSKIRSAARELLPVRRRTTPGSSRVRPCFAAWFASACSWTRSASSITCSG